MTAKHLGVLFDNGSETAAREMVDALRTRGYQAQTLNVERSGNDLVETLFALRPERVLLALQGDRAGAGCIQGLLELLHIPYTGAGILGSAIAFDLCKTRELLRLHAVRVPSHYAGTLQDAAGMIEQHGGFGYPVQLRRRSPGSGQLTVTHPGQWPSAVARLARHNDNQVVVERYHAGDVYRVALLDGRVLGICAEGEVPELAEVRRIGLLQTAKSAAAALCCHGPTLVRLVVSQASNEWVTDVGAAAALGRNSLFAQIAAGAGYDYATLCETVVNGARLQWGRQEKSVVEPRRVSEDVRLDEVSRVA